MHWKWVYILLLLFDNLYLILVIGKVIKKKDLFKLQTKKFVKYLLF